jgi:hypothetical protein
VRPILLVILLGVVASCGAPPPKVDLLIPVNARCTTCEDFIRCDGGSSNPAVYDPTFDLYRLESKSMLAQLATVWEFLIQLFHTRTEDFRPLTIYAQRPGESAVFDRTVTKDAEARTDLLTHRIHLPSGWIDQVNGEWHATDDSIRGSCRALKAVEGRELVKLFAEAGGPP